MIRRDKHRETRNRSSLLRYVGTRDPALTPRHRDPAPTLDE